MDLWISDGHSAPLHIRRLHGGGGVLMRPVPSRPVPTRLVPSRLVPSRLIPSRLIPSRLVPTRLVPCGLISSRLISSRLVPSRLIPSRLIPSRLVPSRLIPSRLIPSRLVLSRLVPSRLIPSRLIPSRLVPTRLVPCGLISSRLISSRLVPSRLIPSRLIPSRLVPSRLVPSRLIPSRLVPSRLIPSRLIPSRLVPSRLVPSRLIPSRLIPSRLVPSRPVPSRLVPSRPVPSSIMAPRRPAALSLLVVFGLLILSTEGRGVQEKLSPDVTAGSFLRGKDEHLERSRLIPDQLLHNEKVLDAFLVGSAQQTMADRLQSAAEIFPSCTQEVLVLTRSTDPSDGNTGQENGSEPQQRLPVSRKLLYNQTVCGSEPDQQNPQMDQVAHEADPVSRTSRTSRTAPSPDGPLVEFDQQQIVMLADDEVVRTAAASLYHKHPAVSSLHAVRPQHGVRQVKGQAAPLSERSSLVLVGHGAREPSGEMRISGYSYRDVARIIQSGSRIGQKIQTTAVVACGVGSDRRFPRALLQTLHEAGLETELHLWKTAVQVAETGDVLSQDGARWRSGDHSKKLVLTVGPTGEISRRDDRRRTGQEVPTNQTALLGNGGNKKGNNNKHQDKEKQPKENPKSFIDPNVYDKVASDLNKTRNEILETFRILESLTWGFFHPEPPKINPQELCEKDSDPSVFIIGERRTKKDNNGKSKTVIEFEKKNNNNKTSILKKCFAIQTGSDIRNIIHHFAKNEKNEVTHLMVNNWIYEVDPETLYVFPVGKKLDKNEESENIINNIEEYIIDQMNKESYPDIRPKVEGKDKKEEHSAECVQYFQNIFLGEAAIIPSPEREAWCTTYFTASVIAESARNFRMFPLTLMALSMKDSRFWFDPNYITMAAGGTWLNKPLRGFSGAAGGNLENLAGLLVREYRTISEWQEEKVQGEEVQFTAMAEISENLRVLTSEEKKNFISDCQTFFDAVKNQQNLRSASGRSNIQPEGQ
ncbi:uncharacterized protein LOC122828568 [Gambusia affinis]|uniref:uncharacterized protein LOC122828568 n=1 Tax=Gambusia affinis TaxID=33528 RepID=UPI001CDD0D61|nr:uncharacterized protein LOC122828568 [Gambusia affinis]